MPPDAAIFVTAVIVAFAAFAVTLAWGVLQAGGPAAK